MSLRVMKPSSAVQNPFTNYIPYTEILTVVMKPQK